MMNHFVSKTENFADTSARESVHDQLLELIYRQTVRGTFPALVVCLMIAILLYRTQPMNLILVWFCVALAYKSVHIILFTIVKKNDELRIQRKLFYVSILGLFSGLVFAGCLFCFNYLPVIDRIILTMTLLAVAAGTVGAIAGYQPLYWSFVTPIVLPLSYLWFSNMPGDIDTVLSVWIGVLILMVTGALAAIGHDTFDFFSGYIINFRKKDQLTAELIDALEQQEMSKRNAELSNQSKTRLLAAVSHDLRQPVHVLNLFGTALNQTELKSDSRRIVSDMNQAITDLSRQINVLLDITRLDEITYEPSLTKLCISDVMNSISLAHKAEIADRGLTLKMDWEPNMWVKSDQQLLAQIIRNLVGNAIKYTSDGSISLHAHSDGEDVLLCVEDTGIGIEYSELHAVFEEYYQIDNPERNQEKGLGLGLSIVKRAADLLGHSVEVRSTPSVGSRFTIRMRREYVDEDSSESFEKTTQSPYPNPVKQRVHVVDDDVMVCKSMRAALEALGCVVSTTQSTEATSEYFSNHDSPDLFIIDIRLQDNDSGFRTQQYVKAFHEHAQSVFVSGELDSFQHPEYDNLTPIIQKPVTGEQLIKLLTTTGEATALRDTRNSDSSLMAVD